MMRHARACSAMRCSDSRTSRRSTSRSSRMRSARILDRVSLAVRFMALFSVVTGVLVLVSAVAASRRQRVRESVLLKTLGATRAQIVRMLFTEYALLGAIGSLAGILLAIGGGWAADAFHLQDAVHRRAARARGRGASRRCCSRSSPGCSPRVMCSPRRRWRRCARCSARACSTMRTSRTSRRRCSACSRASGCTSPSARRASSRRRRRRCSRGSRRTSITSASCRRSVACAIGSWAADIALYALGRWRAVKLATRWPKLIEADGEAARVRAPASMARIDRGALRVRRAHPAAYRLWRGRDSARELSDRQRDQLLELERTVHGDRLGVRHRRRCSCSAAFAATRMCSRSRSWRRLVLIVAVIALRNRERVPVEIDSGAARRSPARTRRLGALSA